MSKFFVGQRVRLVRFVSVKNHGLEGRITGFDYFPAGTLCADGSVLSSDGDCAVHYDGDDLACIESTYRLEPITPSGAQPSEFTTLHDLLESLEGVAA